MSPTLQAIRNTEWQDLPMLPEYPLERVNTWGTPIHMVDTHDYCAHCEREYPQHYEGCDMWSHDIDKTDCARRAS